MRRHERRGWLDARGIADVLGRLLVGESILCLPFKGAANRGGPASRGRLPDIRALPCNPLKLPGPSREPHLPLKLRLPRSVWTHRPCRLPLVANKCSVTVRMDVRVVSPVISIARRVVAINELSHRDIVPVRVGAVPELEAIKEADLVLGNIAGV